MDDENNPNHGGIPSGRNEMDELRPKRKDGTLIPWNEMSPLMRRNYVLHNADRLGVDWAKLPKPFFYASWFGWDEKWLKVRAASMVMATSQLTKRGLTQAETDAVAEYATIGAITMTYEPPMLLAAASYLERRGRATSRFPLWTPNAWAHDSFGPALRWCRWPAYALVVHYALKPILATVAALRVMKFQRNDPRCADILRDERRAYEERAERKRQPVPSSSSPVPLPPVASASSSSSSYPSLPQIPSSNPQEDYARWQEQENEAPSPSSFDSEQNQQADPVSYTVEEPTTKEQSPAKPATGSAWEQLRQKSSSSSWKEQRQRPQAGQHQSSDSFSYSEKDEDRAVAKDQAQKEFDAMLERERQGKGDSGWRK